MSYSAYIFDLDGTLLDTLPDLVRLTNMVLEERGWPTRTHDEILSFVGNGGRNLLGRAAPHDAPEGEVDEAFARWQELYPAYGHELTKPYEGIPETLARLKERGAKLGVLSNKFDAAARSVIEEHFPGLFDLVCGECVEIPRKPDPTGLKKMMENLGVAPAEVAYVGDSTTDVEVARRAGTSAIAVAWGYRSAAELDAAGPDRFIFSPADLC